MTEKLYVGYRVTERCNAGPLCVERCFSRQGLPQQDPLFSTVQDVLIRISPHVHTVNIMGGEPSLRFDLPHIVQAAKESGMNRVLSTNGILLDPDKHPGRLEELVPYLTWLSLSIDARNTTTSSQIRGAGQLEAASGIIRWFAREQPDCKLKINTQVHQKNIDDIAGIAQLPGFLDVVTDWKLLQWTGRGDASKVVDTWSITPEQFSWVVSDMRAAYPEMQIVKRFWPEPEPDTILIRPDGTIQINGKVNDYLPVGNILTEDPTELFERSQTLYRHLSDANRTEYHESYPGK